MNMCVGSGLMSDQLLIGMSYLYAWAVFVTYFDRNSIETYCYASLLVFKV